MGVGGTGIYEIFHRQPLLMQVRILTLLFFFLPRRFLAADFLDNLIAPFAHAISPISNFFLHN